jgi:hypothetical protein
MPSPGTPSAQTSVILDRLDVLRCDISELKGSVETLTSNYQEFVVNYTRAHEQLEAKVIIIRERMDDHEIRLKSLEDLVKPMVYQSRIIAFVGTTLLITIIGFLWAIFTHQVAFVSP